MKTQSIVSTEHEMTYGFEQAGLLLRRELLSDEKRDIWARYLPANVARRNEAISFRAVAKAVASSANHQFQRDDQASLYKDRIRRALMGQSLSHETIDLFARTFHLSDECTNLLKDCVTQQLSHQLERDPSIERPKEYSITNSFYDFYFDSNLCLTVVRASVVLKSKADQLQEIWLTKPSNLLSATHETGCLEWDEKVQLYRVGLPYALSAQESVQLEYTLYYPSEANRDYMGLVEFDQPFSSVFFRCFFEDTEKTPSTIVLERQPIDTASTIQPQVMLLPVYDRERSSLYLDQVREERIIIRQFRHAPTNHLQ